MGFNRELISALYGLDSNLKVYSIIDGVYLEDEWIKWLSYVPDFKKKRIDMLNSKLVSDISLEELEEIRKYKEQIEMLELLKRYNDSSTSKDDYMKAYDFLANEDIEADIVLVIDENGVNQGHGINIDGKIWAPVNCGYHPTDAPRGLFYQWGRKYGQGYHPQTADIWEGKNGEEDKTPSGYALRNDKCQRIRDGAGA